ncbi:MAG: 3'-5' exonuclease domain-containing protein 2 [Bacteroidaceae bacterium]|nr:3'-5' exonuclease domain-containing protein 2 [Bacteroidaceae bacterium]
MITIDSSIDKNTIQQMPQVTYPGTITVVDTIQKAREAVKYLSALGLVGFDTETKPTFRKGIMNKTALLQLASQERAFLFRLNIIGLPDFLCGFLADRNIVKVGLSVKDDFSSLRRHCSLVPESFIELQEYVAEIGIGERGLQRLYALLFGKRISKSQQLSNWEADTLSDGQCQYAAIDAWACVEIYNYIKELRQSGNYQVIRKDAE